jgi:hypothetical protein
MPFPPYRFGKGPIAATLEDYLSDPHRVIVLLKELHAKTEPGRSDFVNFLIERFPKDALHFLHVVGVEFPEGITVEDRKTVEREGRQRLEVFSSGLHTAASLALGIALNTDPSEIHIKDCQNPPHPIDIFWGCGHPFNQSWVSSRPYRDTRVISLVFYSTEPATELTWAPLGEPLTDERLGIVSADRSLVIFLGNPNGGVACFRPPDQMGIPQSLLSQ